LKGVYDQNMQLDLRMSALNAFCVFQDGTCIVGDSAADNGLAPAGWHCVSQNARGLVCLVCRRGRKLAKLLF